MLIKPNRYNTNSLKYDTKEEHNIPIDALPMWVADMDFKLPYIIRKNITKIAKHGVFGYTVFPDTYFDVLYNWHEKHHNFKPSKEWLINTPGIVFAIAQIIKALTNINDSIIINQPVYYPFSEMILSNNRKLINSPLVLKESNYYIDFIDLENKIAENKVKMYIFCSPHNPVGRVWTKDELIKIGDICLKHNCILISDEIHSDFVFTSEHYNFYTLDPKYQDTSIICYSLGKSMNLAGVQISDIFIKNEILRNKVINEIESSGYSQHNIFGIHAAYYSYIYGYKWLSKIKKIIKNNVDLIKSYKTDLFKTINHQGTYLLWIDFNHLELNHEQLNHLVQHKCKLWLDEGLMFGEEGRMFMRVNVATSKSNIQIFLKKISMLEKNSEQ